MRNFASRGPAAAALFALTVCIFAAIVYTAGNYDFRAFYCAGSVASAGGNSYRTEPLFTCERTQTVSGAAWLETPLPAPFPPYVTAAVFEPLSHLPYGTASKLWIALLVFATAGAAALLWDATRLSAGVVAAAFFLSIGIPSIGFGEIVPLYLLCICGALWCARRGRWTAASIAAACALIEPHLGLPVCVVLAVCERRTRLPLTLCGLALAAISATGAGLAQNLEYLGPVLRYHALSELASNQQLSLSSMLFAAGANSNVALLAGAAAYLGGIVCAAVLAARLCDRWRDPAYLIAVPAAFAVMGGTFVHQTQIAAAIPLALLLLARRNSHTVASAIAILLAVPWLWIVTPVMAAFGTIAVLAVALAAPPGARALPAAACAIALLVLFGLALHVPAGATAHALPPIDARYPEAGWAQAIWTHLGRNSPGSWSRRIPVWGALALLASICAKLAFPLREAVLQRA